MHGLDFLNHIHFPRHGQTPVSPQGGAPPGPRSLEQSKSTSSSVNPFVAMSNEPAVIPTRPDHPVPRKFIRSRSSPVSDTNNTTLLPAPTTPLQTNKFYANLFLENQSCPAWSHPYSLWWSRGGCNSKSYGMSVTMIGSDGFAFGPPNEHGCCNYFLAPIGIQHLCFSADELGSTTTMTCDSLGSFSVNVNFSPTADGPALMSLPIVQGMGLVTAVYRGCTPCVQSSIFFRSVTPCGTINNGYTIKYKALLEDSTTWLVYQTSSLDTANTATAPLAVDCNTCLKGGPNFKGYIQVAQLVDPGAEAVYDTAAGAYAVSCTIAGLANGADGRYSLIWHKEGLPKPLLMFALPHHFQSFAPTTSSCVTTIGMRATTKGMMRGVLADQWIMLEQLPIDVGFDPYSLTKGSVHAVSEAAKSLIKAIGAQEVQQDVTAQSCLNSMYFSGKGLAKFAMLLYVLNDIIKAPDLVAILVPKLEAAFAVFVNNTQPNPLVYDEAWKGVVSTAGLNGDPGQDFGNSYYNDHHFHYGYFLYAAAVLGHVDPKWLANAKNTSWVNMLVRDFANPGADDYFPFSRSFDFFHGHSWAKGLFESGDGKDQESTSEDAFASYGIKMWGRISGNASLEASGDFRLAIQKRVFDSYFLMQSDNTIQPSNFIGNKVTGILFENKIDHATYFSAAIECIQGIHMIPISPVSTITRSPKFVAEEWKTYFDNGRVDKVGGGWKGILWANYGIVDPQAAYNFFGQQNFDGGWLDGGASRAWYLAWLAAIGGL